MKKKEEYFRRGGKEERKLGQMQPFDNEFPTPTSLSTVFMAVLFGFAFVF